MGLLPIVPREDGNINDSCYLRNEQLPAFYMEDYSVIGLTVEDIETAVAALQRNGVEIQKNESLAMAQIDGLRGMKKVLDLLETHSITFELTDIADQIYQG